MTKIQCVLPASLCKFLGEDYCIGIDRCAILKYFSFKHASVTSFGPVILPIQALAAATAGPDR